MSMICDICGRAITWAERYSGRVPSVVVRADPGDADYADACSKMCAQVFLAGEDTDRALGAGDGSTT